MRRLICEAFVAIALAVAGAIAIVAGFRGPSVPAVRSDPVKGAISSPRPAATVVAAPPASAPERGPSPRPPAAVRFTPVVAPARVTKPAVTVTRAASPERVARLARASVAGAGMVIAVDPETGEVGMPERAVSEAKTVEEIQALARREAAGLITVKHADGSESLEHEGRFMDFTVLHVGPDGKFRYQCVQGRHGAQHAVRSPAPPVRDAEEE